MKTVNLAAAALLMASTAARAGAAEIRCPSKSRDRRPASWWQDIAISQVSATGLSRSGFNLKGLDFNNSNDEDVVEATPLHRRMRRPRPRRQR